MERFKSKAKGNSGSWGVYDTLRGCFVLQSVSPNAKYNKEVADKAAYLFNVAGLEFDRPDK